MVQVLRLLRLAPEVMETIAGLGEPLVEQIVCERRLRPLVELPQKEQEHRVRSMLGSHGAVGSV